MATGYSACIAALGTGTCQSLEIEGASDSQLALVADGAIDPDVLLSELVGNIPAAGTQVTPASATPQSSITDKVLGSLSNAADATGVSSVASFLSSPQFLAWAGIIVLLILVILLKV